MITTRVGIAEILDVTPATITNWGNLPENPLPIEKRGARGQSNDYNVAVCVAWLIDKRVTEVIGDEDEFIDYDREKARLTRQQADKEEILNQVRRQEYAPIEILTDSLQIVAGQINSILGGIAAQCRKRLPHLTAREVEIIQKEVVKAQNAASQIQIDEKQLSKY